MILSVFSPPLTTPFVQIADMERPVMVVTTQLNRITTIPRPGKQKLRISKKTTLFSTRKTQHIQWGFLFEMPMYGGWTHTFWFKMLKYMSDLTSTLLRSPQPPFIPPLRLMHTHTHTHKHTHTQTHA